MMGNILWTVSILLYASTAALVNGLRIPTADSNISSQSEPYNTSVNFGQGLELRNRADKVPLRILSLGASVVFGLGSTDGNGFRKPLRDQLRFSGWEVNMVGSLQSGEMADNDVEAKSGNIITDVQAASKASLGYKANLVVINAGTSDCFKNVTWDDAGERMRTLIEELLASDGWDRAVIVLSTLIRAGDPLSEYCRDNTDPPNGGMNAQYRVLVEAMQREGKKIILADMDPLPPSPGRDWIEYPTDYNDIAHPNDYGYKKMAYIFWDAIETAHGRGWFQKPYRLHLSSGNFTDNHGDDQAPTIGPNLPPVPTISED